MWREYNGDHVCVSPLRDNAQKKTTRYAKRNAAERQAFQATLAALNEEQLVWVDECGVDQDLYRLHARSPRGVPVLVDIQDKRFAPRISIIAAYHQHQLCAPLRFEGSTDTTLFNTWIEQGLVPVLQPGQVVIMDNARFHQSATTRHLIEQANCQLLFQPTYSPDLNKIEHQWAVLKQGIRATLNPDLSFLDKLDQQLIHMSNP